MHRDDEDNEQAANLKRGNKEKQKTKGAATSAAIQQVQEEAAVHQAKQAVTEKQSGETEDTQYVGEPLVVDEGVCAIGSADQNVTIKETKKDEKKSSQPQLDPSDPNYMLTCKASDFKQIAKNIKNFQEDKAKAGQKQEKVLITGAKDPGKVIEEIDMLDNGAYISEATIDFDDKTKSKKSYKENKVGGKLKKLNNIVKTKKETNKNVEKLNKYGIQTHSKKYQDGYNMLLKASQYGKDIPKALKLKINAHFKNMDPEAKAELYGHFLATSRNIDQEGNTLTSPTAKVENTKKRSKAIIETKVGLRFIDDDNLKIKKGFIGLVDNTILHQGAALDVIDKVETVKSIVDSAVGDTVNKLINQPEITTVDILNFKKTLISMDDNINTVVGSMEADIVTMKISGEELVKAKLIEKPVPTKIDRACTSTKTTMSGGFMFKLKSKVGLANGKGHQLITTLRTYNAGKESKRSKSVKEMVADMEKVSPVKPPSYTTHGQIPVPHSVAPKTANDADIDNLVQKEGVKTVISPLTAEEAKTAPEKAKTAPEKAKAAPEKAAPEKAAPKVETIAKTPPPPPPAQKGPPPSTAVAKMALAKAIKKKEKKEKVAPAPGKPAQENVVIKEQKVVKSVKLTGPVKAPVIKSITGATKNNKSPKIVAKEENADNSQQEKKKVEQKSNRLQVPKPIRMAVKKSLQAFAKKVKNITKSMKSRTSQIRRQMSASVIPTPGPSSTSTRLRSNSAPQLERPGSASKKPLSLSGMHKRCSAFKKGALDKIAKVVKPAVISMTNLAHQRSKTTTDRRISAPTPSANLSSIKSDQTPKLRRASI